MADTEKKVLTERDRRRIKANQAQRAINQEKNDKTQTNLTYEAIQKEYDELDNKAGKQYDKISSDGKPDGTQTKDHEVSDEDKHGIDQEDDSTDASQDSDTESSYSHQEVLSRKEYLFAGSGDFIKYWNNLVIVLALYNALFIPLQLFFKEKGHSVVIGETVSFIDACVDLFFLIDIIIKFRTTFLDAKQSIEVKDPHVIGKRYLKGSFTIDFISSVPFTSFLSSGAEGAIVDLLDALGLLKLLRLSRLYQVVQSANLSKDLKVYLKVCMMWIILVVFIHVLGCIWFAVTSAQERWVQNMDFMYAAQPHAYQGFFEGDDAFLRKYLILLYTGFYVFGVGEIVPRAGSFEFFAAFILCSLCTIFNAVIIGYMTSYTEELSKKTRELNDKLNLTNTAMISLNLTSNLKKDIIEYINQTHRTQELQQEFTSFNDQISPLYRRKVTKEFFKIIVRTNSVLSQIKKQFIDAKRLRIPHSWNASRRSVFETQQAESTIMKLVVKLTSVATSPDLVYIQQEDASHVDPENDRREAHEDYDDSIETENDSFMYFVRDGTFKVFVKTDHLTASFEQEEAPKPANTLIDGDHFGEIGLLYQCRRTATVISSNYGTLAKLQKKHFLELAKTFDMFTSLFRTQIYKYNDELTMWLNIEMDKIPYFRNLSIPTKQELILGMERKTYDKGDIICEKDTEADRLFLIQDGIIEVAVAYDRRREEQPFVIERLGRGAIINHRSFLIRDEADTDFVCKTTVSIFYLTYDKLRDVANKRQDLQREREQQKKVLYAPMYPLALDYIFHNNEQRSQESYRENLRKGELKVKFKNAIMQLWTKVKEETKPGNLDEMINGMIKQKRASASKGIDYAAQQRAAEELKQKQARRKERRQEKMSNLENAARDSYLNVDQFKFLTSKVEQSRIRLGDQQKHIDNMEQKMIALLKERDLKENGSKGDDKSGGPASEYLQVSPRN